MCCEPSSSEGLGGRVPAASTLRPPGPPQRCSTSATWARPTRMSVSPTEPSSPSMSATRGRRRSPSTSTTGWPACARAMARLTAVVDLPSRGTELVTTNERGRPVRVDVLQVGAQLAVGLGAAGADRRLGDQRVLGHVGVEGEHAERGQVDELLQRGDGLDPGVQGLAQHRAADADGQADEQSRAPGSPWAGGTTGRWAARPAASTLTLTSEAPPAVGCSRRVTALVNWVARLVAICWASCGEGSEAVRVMTTLFSGHGGGDLAGQLGRGHGTGPGR